MVIDALMHNDHSAGGCVMGRDLQSGNLCEARIPTPGTRSRNMNLMSLPPGPGT